MKELLDEAQQLFGYTRDIRRDIHRHPELGFGEVRTAGLIAGELKKLDLEVMTGVGKTGVVALIEGEKPGLVVLLRFDMDALPIQEENNVDYISQATGKMHACGHDGHVAVGLTVARLLANHRKDFQGTVKLMFQPAEEGLGGAESMIASSLLDAPHPDAAFAFHIWNEKPVGWLGVTSGPVMASSDIFHVSIRGTGGHGAAPHQTVDPIAAAAQIINTLQTIVARNVPPLKSAVVSVTKINGGEAFNIIPSAVTFDGTIRTFDPDVRLIVLDRFDQIINGIARAMGCRAEIQVNVVTPPVINDLEITEKIKTWFHDLIPNDFIDTTYQTMGSEDMAFVLQKIPGCYFFVGSANHDKSLTYGHHHPRFDFDEQILPKASALMADAAINYLLH